MVCGGQRCKLWALNYTVLLVTVGSVRCTADCSGKASHTNQGLVWDRDFGITSYMFSGEWSKRAYQATIHMRPVCQGSSSKHMRLLISITTAPHPYYHRETPVTPNGWFTYGEGGMPKVWFEQYGSGNQTLVKQHVDDHEVDGAWMFDREYLAQCWLGTANLEQNQAYTLHIQGSERSYQAVAPGSCPSAHHIFFAPDMLPDNTNTGVTRSANLDVATGTHVDTQPSSIRCNAANSPSDGSRGGIAVAGSGPVWLAVVQKAVSAKHLTAYMVRQHLEYHMRLGMVGMLLACDHFVCLELLQDPVLASRGQEGRLVLWVWTHGHEHDKPLHKLNAITNMMRMAAYGTPTLFAFYDLDEFMVIPSGQPITTLLAPGGCMAGVRKHSQTLINSMVTVAKNWTSADPNMVGELPAWLEYDVWVDAVEALNYSMAPQGFLGWKAIVDPNFDYNFNCHDHIERYGYLHRSQVNYVNESCAYNMHFTNWFSNRINQHTIGGTKGDPTPVQQWQLDALHTVYQTATQSFGLSPFDGCTQHQSEEAAATQHFTMAEELVSLAGTANSSSKALKAVSVTLITRPAEILLGEALSSVNPFVDACLVVYPSSFDSPQLSLRAAADAVGDKLIVQRIEPAGLSAMLNVSLAWAMKLGAEWAVLLGRDQQVLAEDDVLLYTSNAVNSTATQFNCYHQNLEYLQAFMVKLSAGGGFIHDQYVQPQGGGEAGIPGCSITRPAKTQEWQQRRAKQAIQAVHAAGEATNCSQTAWFMLAEAQWVLGEQHNATEAWHKCIELEQSPQLAALCGYRLALLAAQNKAVTSDQVVEALRQLVDIHGCSPELCWFAALTAYRAGKHQHAKDWALQAVQTGCYAGSCMSEGRIRYKDARYELPFDVLRFALMQLGDSDGAEQARENFDQALVARQEAEQARKPAIA